jgi:preprotein translocase subunit SecA
MLQIISKLFGGSKSEKDVKKIQHLVGVINGHFQGYKSLSNDDLRAKTTELKASIKAQTSALDALIEQEQNKAEALELSDLMGRDAIYENIDKIKKDRDQEIEKVLWDILPEAFAVVKEAARRFTEEEELVSTATD